MATISGDVVPLDLRSHLEEPGWRTRLSRGRLAQWVLERGVRDLPARIALPDGTIHGSGDPRDPTLAVLHPDLFYRRLEAHPSIGLGEGYMAGDWRAGPGTDLGVLLTAFADRLDQLLPAGLLRWQRLVQRAVPEAHRNTLAGSRANIAAHYDLSNALFATFLDPSMTYSSALFDNRTSWRDQTLLSAQDRKIQSMLDQARVGPGSRVLEIGTGWGELAIQAARRGALVVSITLSMEQQTLAQQRIAAAGLADAVAVRLQDYRTITGDFDAVISVEMIEAVGEEYWADYFTAIDRVLARGGAVSIQAILMEHAEVLRTKDSYGWIKKYIFPGGLIPSLQAIQEVTARHTSLSVTQVHRFGAHYAQTLQRWRTAFVDQSAAVTALGFDDVFQRMWEYYLAYCEAGFASGYLDVGQIVLRRAGP